MLNRIAVECKTLQCIQRLQAGRFTDIIENDVSEIVIVTRHVIEMRESGILMRIFEKRKTIWTMR